MKITEPQLRKIIKEELSLIYERVAMEGEWKSTDEQIRQLMNNGGDYLMAAIERLEARIEALEGI